MTDSDIDIEKAQDQLLVIGKAIEHSKIQDAKQLKSEGKNKNKELAKRFAKALGEIEKDGQEVEEQGKEQQKGWLRKILKGFESRLLEGGNEKSSEMKKKEGKSHAARASKEKSVKNLSAELEVAVARLRSVSTIDSSKNDMEITKAMEKVMSISSELSSKVPANKSPDLERAGIAIADVSVTFKNNSASVAQVSENKQSLNMAQESIGDSAKTDQNAITGDIREALSSTSPSAADNSSLPMTKEAKLRKEREAEAFVDPSMRKR